MALLTGGCIEDVVLAADDARPADVVRDAASEPVSDDIASEPVSDVASDDIASEPVSDVASDDIASEPVSDVASDGARDAAVPDAAVPDAAVPDVACPAVPALSPDGDPWGVGLPSAGAATMRMVTVGTHRDVYLRGPGGVAEIGVRLDWGGGVVFFGQAGVPGSNTIDANDTGRELQIALYDPTRLHQQCARDASCTGTSPCGNSITFLGWNPVQGGDECNRGARVLRSELVGDRLVVAVRPLQWNPDWDAPDCRRSACGPAGVEVGVTYTLGFRFVHPNVVEVDMQVSSAESLSHPSTEQEFPTLYVGNGMNGSTDLPLLLDAAGTPIAVDLPANDGFTYRNFRSEAGWVTWQHAARDYGVALAMDHAGADFQGWAGSGRGAPYFHNVRPRQRFGLAAGATVRGRAYLALGSEGTVASLMRLVRSRRAPFGVVDAPSSETVARARTLRVRGWVLDDAALPAVSLRLDGREVATLPRSAERPDVCAVYPNYAGCPRAGFDGEVTLPPGDGCVRLLTVVARDADGNETLLARRLVRP